MNPREWGFAGGADAGAGAKSLVYLWDRKKRCKQSKLLAPVCRAMSLMPRQRGAVLETIS